MCKLRKEKIDIKWYFFSYFFFLFLLLWIKDWGSLLSLFFIYLWITYWFQLKKNKKVVLFTLFVILFHSFCGKLLLFSKICMEYCYIDSYFLSLSKLDQYKILQNLPEKVKKRIIEHIIQYFVFLQKMKTLKESGYQLTWKEKITFLFFVHNENLEAIYIRRFSWKAPKEKRKFFSSSNSLLVSFHFILFLIYLVGGLL